MKSSSPVDAARASQTREVAQGQSEELRRCRYQLAQPVLDTVPAKRLLHRSLNLACTCGLMSVRSLRLRTARLLSSTHGLALIMKMTELGPRLKIA